MKIKTKKSAVKRIKKKNFFLIRKKAYKSHLLKHKTSNRLRRLSKKSIINHSDLKVFYKLLGN